MNRYYNPVRTVEGDGCLSRLPAVLVEMALPEKRVLVLAWSRQALEHPAVAALLEEDSGFQAKGVVFTASNPTVEQLFQVWQETQDFAPEAVVAIGGGSVLDVGKSLCCLYGRDLKSVQDVREAVAGGKLRPAARWIGVPTTAGTGSEVTCWATIWDPEQDCKRSLESHENYAYAALVDPALAKGMPVRLAVSSALDAAAHAVESYWANHTNAVSRGLALEAVSTIMGGIDGLLENAPAAHEAMARGSLLAGLAFSNTKTTACHSISYPLTMHYGIPHGAAVAMLLAPVLKLNAPAVPGVDRLLEALGVRNAADLKVRVDGLLKRSGQPAALKDWGVQPDDLPRLAALGMTRGGRTTTLWCWTRRRSASSKTIMDLLRSMTRKRNIACIVNLHQLDVALQYSTRIIGLSKGEIVFDGPPQQLDDETIQRIYGTTCENLMLGGKDHA